LVVERTLVVEVKSVDQLARIHAAQVLTYLRLSVLETAFLINFNSALLKDSLRRFASPPPRAPRAPRWIFLTHPHPTPSQ
jgi:PD-(D/E)XK nuclease superfamily